MKIIQINKRYYPWIGGIETVVQVLSEFLGKENKLDVSVLTCNDNYKTQTDIVNTIPVKRMRSIGDFFSMPISLSFIHEFKTLSADILHFHLPNPLAIIAYLVYKPKGKVVVTWHSDIIRQKFFLLLYKPLLNHFLVNYVDKIIVTSPDIKEKSPFLKKLHDKIEVIPLGIVIKDYSLNKEIIKKQNDIIKKHPKFALFVGRFVYYKGVFTLLEAIRNTTIQLVMIGEGPLKTKMQSYIKKYCPKQVTLIPPTNRETLNGYFSSCSYFVLPSTHASEAFGIVQLEAMIYEKAVISSNLPTGVPFVNKDNETGIIVPPKDSSSLKEAMSLLWDNPKKCLDYGKSGKNRVLSLFTVQKMCKDNQKLYEKLIKNAL